MEFQISPWTVNIVWSSEVFQRGDRKVKFSSRAVFTDPRAIGRINSFRFCTPLRFAFIAIFKNGRNLIDTSERHRRHCCVLSISVHFPKLDVRDPKPASLFPKKRFASNIRNNSSSSGRRFESAHRNFHFGISYRISCQCLIASIG